MNSRRSGKIVFLMHCALIASLLLVADALKASNGKCVATTSTTSLSSSPSFVKRPITKLENEKSINFKYDDTIMLSSIRGGDVEDSDDNAVEDKSIVGKVFSVFGNSILGTVYAFKRAIDAGLDAVLDQESSAIGKLFNMMTSMTKAMFDKDFEPRAKAAESSKNFAEYLCGAYGVSLPEAADEYDDDDDDEGAGPEHIKIMSGSLSHALRNSRSKARLLVVFIPGAKPSKKQKNDIRAIKSLMSTDVQEISERNARKKEEGGSFSFWSTKNSSGEASVALKRLKVKSTSNKSPILMVVYPSQSIGASGEAKVVPRVLAQHHCKPPPSNESMALWLNALRKRHAKQYANMQLELKELALYKERKKGYKSSMKDDKKREREELMKEQKRLEEEKAKKEKEEMLTERRKTLLEELPDEPERGSEGIITIALRFSDGKKGQRRFDVETEVDQVFNWVDATFKLERERVVLTTMNGQKSFTYGEDSSMTLEVTGLGKMAALRVSEQVDDDVEEEEVEESSDEDDDGDEEEDEE
uniref:UBX domain-containing protein n=1 Tax=Chaetoceros debilis TaxID=122233 RepID=A0A7S3Q4N9_9STRA